MYYHWEVLNRRLNKFNKCRLVIFIRAMLGFIAFSVLFVPVLGQITEEEWFEQGIDLVSQENFSDAVKAFDEAIRINPNYEDAWYNKGIALMGLHLPLWDDYDDKAVNAFDEAIRINPNNAEAWYNKGIALHSSAREEEAILAFNESIRINPNDAVAWFNYGKVLADDQYKAEAAVNALDEAIRIDPNYAEAWRLKGYILDRNAGTGTDLDTYDKDMLNESLTAFNEVIRINPNDSLAYRQKANVLYHLNRETEYNEASAKAYELEEQENTD